nr:hypothetical protein Iba_chr13aCG0830 [Ipomoea batatas]
MARLGGTGCCGITMLGDTGAGSSRWPWSRRIGCWRIRAGLSRVGSGPSLESTMAMVALKLLDTSAIICFDISKGMALPMAVEILELQL